MATPGIYPLEKILEQKVLLGSEQVFQNGKILNPGSENDYILEGNLLTIMSSSVIINYTDRGFGDGYFTDLYVGLDSIDEIRVYGIY